MKIRESLTGRLSRLRLFPLLLSEIHSLGLGSTESFFLHFKPRISRGDLLKDLERGGMPGVFATRNPAERHGQIQDWVSLTVERDALQIPTRKINPALLMRVLSEIARHPEPEAGRIAKSLRLSSVAVKALIDALKTLFVVHEIQPHPAGSGKPRYYLCDPGICAYLGGNFERQLETRFYLEQLGKLSYLEDKNSAIFSYFRSSKGSLIHGVWEKPDGIALLKILPTEGIDERELLILSSTSARLKEARGGRAIDKIDLYALAGIAYLEKVGDVRVLPWESMA